MYIVLTAIIVKKADNVNCILKFECYWQERCNFQGSIHRTTLCSELLSLMKPLHIYRGYLTTVKLVHLIICCCIYQIFSAKQIDVNFGLSKIFTVSSWKTFVSYPATIIFFSKWHINELFSVVKDPCVFRFTSLHLSTQSCLFFSAGQDSFLRTSIILILVLCSHKYTTPSW